jgi:predicted acetyltransferase
MQGAAMNARYEHLLRRSQDAKRGGREAWAVQSTGERVAVALVLNRVDWLAELDYSIAEAIERSGQEWMAFIPQVAHQLSEED